MSERIDEDVPGDAAGPGAAGQDGAGIPDGFARLWMPHRMAYIKGEGKPAGGDEGDGCPFCRIPGLDDADGLIVARGALVYSVLNLYPYNAGHLMVVPYRHVADYTDLAADETAELADFTKRAMTALRAASGAQGFNIGMNMGSVAGAGIAAHLHQHVVPRWGGDTNFMPVVGHTRVLPQLLRDTRDLIAAPRPCVERRASRAARPWRRERRAACGAQRRRAGRSSAAEHGGGPVPVAGRLRLPSSRQPGGRGPADDDVAVAGPGAHLGGLVGRLRAVGGVHLVAHRAEAGVHVEPGRGARLDADLDLAEAGAERGRAAADPGDPDVPPGGAGGHVRAGAADGDVAVGRLGPQAPGDLADV